MPTPASSSAPVLYALVDIVSSAGDFKTGMVIPRTVPEHARKAWIRKGLAGDKYEKPDVADKP